MLISPPLYKKQDSQLLEALQNLFDDKFQSDDDSENWGSKRASEWDLFTS